ncbi:MAG: hypothetical protein WC933_01185 [Candidatus Paceibacterota bacterium]|jgi:hypothetical protein
MENLQFISIGLEFIIGVIATIIAFKGRGYMFGLAFTFFVYVFYDLSKIFYFGMIDSIMPILFLLATLAALVSVCGIYKRN